MKIYTRTGDKGETSLYTGQRISKSDPTIDAIGTVDECNCAIGVAISMLPELNKLRNNCKLFNTLCSMSAPL